MYKEILKNIKYRDFKSSTPFLSLNELSRVGSYSCFEAAAKAYLILFENNITDCEFLTLERKNIKNPNDILGHIIIIYQDKGFYGSIGLSRYDNLSSFNPIFKTKEKLIKEYIKNYYQKGFIVDKFGLINFNEVNDLKLDLLRNKEDMKKLHDYLISKYHYSVTL